MKDLLLDENGDIAIDNFDLVFTRNEAEYVSQKLGFKLTLVKGEWFLNKSKGISYFKDVYKKNPDLKIIGDLFKVEINSIPEIRRIESFEITIPNIREMLLSFSVSLISGEIINFEELL